VWGGTLSFTPHRFARGASFDPATNTWSLLPPSPLGPREYHSAVWTGREMIVWGGTRYASGNPCTGNGPPVRCWADGAAYDPATGGWRSIPAAPVSGRSHHTAVWTGSRMIVFGGFVTGSVTRGASFDPATNRWEALPAAPIEHERREALGAWTGSEMLVWGGSYGQNDGRRINGAAYDPARRRWRTLAPLPSNGRAPSVTAWTGSKIFCAGMFVPLTNDPSVLPNAYLYDPSADRWTKTSNSPPWPGRGAVNVNAAAADHGDVYVWTAVGIDLPPGGFAYDSKTDRWRRIAPATSGSESYRRTFFGTDAGLVLHWTPKPALYRTGR
jgi:N-acetylneuraminic acid mutarotase